MPDLSFAVSEASPLPYAVTPTLALRLRVMNDDPDQVIHTVALRCQVQIEATRRRYTASDQARLRDLFGEPERGAKLCAACSGHIPAPSCRNSPEPARSMSTSPALSTSISPRTK